MRLAVFCLLPIFLAWPALGCRDAEKRGGPLMEEGLGKIETPRNERACPVISSVEDLDRLLNRGAGASFCMSSGEYMVVKYEDGARCSIEPGENPNVWNLVHESKGASRVE